MRFLFVKGRLGWPRTYGHDVHAYEMMRALQALGHSIALATDLPTPPKALDGLQLSERWLLSEAPGGDDVPMSYLQERYRRYWGVPVDRIDWLGRLARDWRADVVVVVGLETLPYLVSPVRALRVWYAADEWVWHYLSQVRADPGGLLTHLRQAAIKGIYERAFGPAMDRVWVVSEVERRAMRLVAGCRNVDIVPNGVDAEAFVAADTPAVPQSAIFWGRLGFGPNIQALRWFMGSVWPLIRERVPAGRFTIAGADPPEEVLGWIAHNDVDLVANPEDLRPEISRHAVVVLPFVSGGGIKNKFLEAAAMGRPIVATKHSMQGLRTRPPVALVDTPEEFADAVVRFWLDTAGARAAGKAARDWVLRHHTWRAAAEEALRPLMMGRAAP